jgi:hypothetical protein
MRHAPAWRRERDVDAITSLFVEVVTTAPDAHSTLGTMTLVVFPERVGPKIRALRCDPDHTQDAPRRPRRMPRESRIVRSLSMDSLIIATVESSACNG